MHEGVTLYIVCYIFLSFKVLLHLAGNSNLSMSLFPAAGAVSDGSENNSKPNSNDWLKNQSFNSTASFVKLQNKQDSTSESPSDEDEEPKRKKIRHVESKEITIPVVKIVPRSNSVATSEKKSFVVDLLKDVPLFSTDLKSDKDNVHFGRPYKVNLPRYYRDLFCCVGTPKWRYISVRKSKRKKRKIGTDKNERYYNTVLFPHAELINCSVKALDNCSIPDLSKFFLDKDVTEESETSGLSSEQSDWDSYAKKMTEDLNRGVREDPKNFEKWMRLIDWQNEIMKDTPGPRRTRAINEKKIEILKSAIKSNPKTAEFQLMKVKLQSEIESDTSSLDKAWENLLFRFPTCVEVWQGYIHFINCNDYHSFSIKRTRRAFGHCLEIFRSIKRGTFNQELSVAATEERLLQIFTLYTDFIAATGHTEQWVAIYQCILEVNFRGPVKSLSHSDLVDYMRKYYESPELKIGQMGSKGFREWLEKHDAGGWVSESISKVEEVDEDEDDFIDKDNTLAQNWFKLEQHRCNSHWLPWHCSSTEECEDEDRKISYNNIKSMLFVVDDISLKLQIIRNFLKLFGTPVAHATTCEPPYSNHHPFFFLHPHQVLQTNSVNCKTKPLMLTLGTQPHISDIPLLKRCLGCNSGALDMKKHKFICQVFDQVLLSDNGNELKNLLALEYMEYYENRIFCLYHCKKLKELTKSSKQARKTARKILHENSELLQVWCCLAVIEWMSGKIAEAFKIFQTTLDMSSNKLQNLDRSTRRKREYDIVFMCNTFIQLHAALCTSCLAESENDCSFKSLIMAALVAVGDNLKFSEHFGGINPDKKQEFPPTHIMKAASGYIRRKEELESLYEQEEYEQEAGTLATRRYSTYCHFVCCHKNFCILFGYADEKDGIVSAMAFLRRKISKDSVQALRDLEYLHYNILPMLKKNITKDRREYRDAVYLASVEFPNNAFFARLLCDVDLSSYLSSGVRHHFSQCCKKTTHSVVPWLCLAHYEMLRRSKVLEASAVAIGTNESGRLLDTRIRNLFERALENEHLSGSIVLWRAYLAAEAEINPQNAYGIYTRAVNVCSWSRDIHIDMLLLQPDLLEEVIENMNKKGLRLRTPLEEVKLLMAM